MNKTLSLIVLTLAVCVGAILFLALWGVLFRLVLMVLLGSEAASNLSFLSYIVLVLMPWSRLRTRKPYRIAGEIVIDRPVSAVWDAIALRARDDYFAPSLKHVDVLGEGRFRFRSTLKCDLDIDVVMEVTDVEPHAYLRYVPDAAAKLPLWGNDLESTEYTLRDAGSGRTEIHLVETLKCLRLFSFLSLLFLNPARDGLKALKSHCEGSATTSWMAAETAAEAAGQATLSEHAVLISGLTACVFVTGIAFALVAWAL